MKKTNKLSLLLLILFGSAGVCADLTADGIRSADAEIRRLEEAFGRDSAAARLSILCLDRFANDKQKESLGVLASETIRAIEPVLARQQELKKQMEDDPGQDWEQKYGQTGLWTTCTQSILRGQYLLARCRFWGALCNDAQKKRQLDEVIALCENDQSQWRGEEQILHVLALWQRGGAGDGDALRVILHQMMVRSDLTEQAAEQMLLLQKRFELFGEGPFAEGLAGVFGRKLAAKEDFEWALEYAFLELGAGRQEPLRKVQETWPQAEEFVQGLLREKAADHFRRYGQQAVQEKMEAFRAGWRQRRDPNQLRAFEEQWQAWIRTLDPNSPGMDRMRTAAAAEYVQHLFDRPDRENAERIVRFLKTEIGGGDPGLAYLYVQALTLLDRYGQAVTAMASIPFECRNGAFDLYVLENFAGRLEDYTDLSGVSIEPAALNRAQGLCGCFVAEGKDRDRVDLLWAQMASRQPTVDGPTGQAIDAILKRFEESSKAEAVGCRALRMMQKGLWGQAARQWQTLRGAYEPKDRTARARQWHWWRAKYYELYCYWKVPEVSKEDVSHAIKILGTLYDPPPAVWAEKLKALTQEKK